MPSEAVVHNKAVLVFNDDDGKVKVVPPWQVKVVPDYLKKWELLIQSDPNVGLVAALELVDTLTLAQYNCPAISEEKLA